MDQGNNEKVVHRGFRRSRIRRRRAPATGRPCPGCTHSLHPSRITCVDHSGARDESSGESECHAVEYLLYHCGHLRSLRKVIVTGPGPEAAVTYACSRFWTGLRVAGGYSQRPSPRLGTELAGARTIHSPRSTRCPSGTRRGLVSRHEEVAALEAAKSQLKSPTAEATLKVKNHYSTISRVLPLLL